MKLSRLQGCVKRRLIQLYFLTFMKTLRHTAFVYAANRSLLSGLVGCIIFAATPLHVCWSQSEVSPSEIPSGPGSIDEIAREQELQRKEEELLKALSSQTVQAPQVSAPPAQQVKASTIKVPAKVEAVAEGDSFSQVAAEPEKHPLRALEHHPALDVRRESSTKQPLAQPSNTIRTHVPDDTFDGATAARVGTFTRVDRSQPRSNGLRRETAPSHTVSLREIEEEASLRHASLSFNEVATIRNGSTRLKIGPARTDANLTPLPQYSEVTIDYRSGAWYRVRTGTGDRGWVHGSSLLFDAGISPRSALRIGAVDSNIR